MSNIPTHTGSWTDWSRGEVFGKYRTFPVGQAQYIIGGNAAFVTYVGGCFWQIYAFLVHRYLATRQKPDLVTLQHRLIYRNDATAQTAATNAFWLYWTWKPWTWKPWTWKLWKLCPPCTRLNKRARHVGSRSFGFIALAVLIFGAFSVASVFSSHIAAPAYQNTIFLVQNGFKHGQCGLALFDGSNKSFNGFDVKNANDARAAASYSRSCYSPDIGLVNSISCNVFVKQKLNYTAQGVQCPFGKPDRPFPQSICNFNGNKAAYQVTTALLDSHEDFGINAAPHNRLKLRKQLTCSPLSQTGFTSTESAHGSEANGTVTNYNYGGVPNVASYTYQYNPAAANDNVPFEIFTLYHNATGPAQWIPVSNLSRSDADVAIIFIAPNSVAFREKVADPLFQTTYPTTIPLPTESFTVYYPDYQVSVLGCVEQYSICKSESQCTRPGGQEALGREIQGLGLNEDQFVTAQRFMYMIAWANTYSSVNGIGPEALRLWSRVYGFVSPAIPDDQWQIEVEGWFETTLAKWQAFMVEFAFIKADLGLHGHVGFPVTNETLDPIWKGQCGNQRKSNLGGYQNVSVFGLAFTWAAGGFIIVLSWSIKWIVTYSRDKLHRRHKRGARERRIAWNVDGKLQQHRIALRTVDYTALKGGDGDVPYLDEEVDLPLPFEAVEEGDDTLYRRVSEEESSGRRSPSSIRPNGVHIEEAVVQQPKSDRFNPVTSTTSQRSENSISTPSGSNPVARSGTSSPIENQHGMEEQQSGTPESHVTANIEDGESLRDDYTEEHLGPNRASEQD